MIPRVLPCIGRAALGDLALTEHVWGGLAFHDHRCSLHDGHQQQHRCRYCKHEWGTWWTDEEVNE